MSFGPIVSPAWVAGHVADRGLRVVDVRWYLDGRSGRDAYERGHIPGAVFVDLDHDITGPQGAGRHPLPAAEQFAAAMARAGISNATRVVVYDDEGGSIAARLWWLLRYFGHDEVAVLDGGLQAWPGQLQTASPEVAAAEFSARPARQESVVDFVYVAEHQRELVLLDARAPERYRGEVEPVDAKAGHIPGARNAPWKKNLDDSGCFKTPDELRRLYAQQGVETGGDVVVYCGSGVTSCHDLVALELAGFTGARLYAGSWSDWARRAAPIATGSEPTQQTEAAR